MPRFSKEKKLVREVTGVKPQRAKVKTTYAPSTPIATDMHLPNHSGITGNQDATSKLDDRYVNVTGDTMTGDLEMGSNNIEMSGIIKNMTRSWDFTIIDPNSVQDTTNEIFIAWATAALTITKIQIELDISTQDITGDLKYADDFQGLASATVINDIDTTSGKRTDTSITSASVASGKAIYISFDAQPHADITQMHVHIEWDYD